MTPSRSGTAKKESDRLRLMVVDDDERAVEIFHDKLQHSGYDVKTAQSAEEGSGSSTSSGRPSLSPT